ncbi:MAG: hypothetical protein ALECFALPRED_000629 [Alectoria fallacina]|uniref:Uncharacterized protein n=1 Tax=Alectoria fallacina TaxID=1903189 RepID=A0A8H3EM79_9LECA|nr:MAG: hypothetical protein ALECFALPRED_000629 [Alectoria fallacina]
MTRKSRSRSPTTRDTSLAIRTRDPLAQNEIITPAAGKSTWTQADQCPFPGCENKFPHRHPTAERTIAPPIDEFRKINEAMYGWWADEQRRRIAENEEKLRQLGVVEPRVSHLSIRTHLPRGNDLTVQEQVAIIHGGATPTQEAATRGRLLERQRQDIVDDTSHISPVSPAQSGVPQIKDAYNSQAEWDEFPDLDATYGPSTVAGDLENLEPAIGMPLKPTAAASYDGHKGTGLPNDVTTEPFLGVQYANPNLLCDGPCPIQSLHHQGAYLQQGQIPRLWNARWGYSDPPRGVWEAWVRIEQGRSSSQDRLEVDGFSKSHWWVGP